MMRTWNPDKLELYRMNLRLFDNTNVTTSTAEGNDLSAEMKTYYSDYIIDNAVPKLVHDQFGQKHPIPKNGGDTIEFRQYSPLAKALTPLTEGVTPHGNKLNVSTITAKVAQYGDYIEISDRLQLTAIDNNIVQATKILGNQAGETLDTITREVLNGGTNVQYAEGQVAARNLLVGGKEEGNHYLTVDAIMRAVRFLKTMKASKIGDSFVGIIHPDVSYDLMRDPAWVNVKTYCDPKDMYEGEIGKIAGVRFVETTEAKIFSGADLASDSRTLTVNGASVTGVTAIPFDGGTVAEGALVGRLVNIGGTVTKVTANTASQLTVSDSITAADNTVIYPGEGGAEGRDVYSTLILGDNAYGVTEIEGGGLQHIVKQLGSGGTSDPLNQRATTGWKAMKTAERLVEAFMVRIETTSTFQSGMN